MEQRLAFRARALAYSRGSRPKLFAIEHRFARCQFLRQRRKDRSCRFGLSAHVGNLERAIRRVVEQKSETRRNLVEPINRRSRHADRVREELHSSVPWFSDPPAL